MERQRRGQPESASCSKPGWAPKNCGGSQAVLEQKSVMIKFTFTAITQATMQRQVTEY